MIVIHRTYDIQHARILVSFLQANGVDAILLDDATASVMPFVTKGVRIAVEEGMEDQALRLIEEQGVDVKDV